MKKERGIRVWGESQLPMEAANDCKLFRFEINAFSLYVINKINETCNHVVEKGSSIARASILNL